MESQGKRFKQAAKTANSVGEWQGILEPDMKSMVERSLDAQSTADVVEARVDSLHSSVSTMAGNVGDLSAVVVDEIRLMKSQIARLQSQMEAVMAKNNVDK